MHATRSGSESLIDALHATPLTGDRVSGIDLNSERDFAAALLLGAGPAGLISPDTGV
jgi:hypothetical protein